MSAIFERHPTGANLALFETELGWIALAHDGQALLQLVFGYDSAATARSALNAFLGNGRVKRIAGSALRKVAKGRNRSVNELEPGEPEFDAASLISRLQAYAAGQPGDFTDVPVRHRNASRFRSRVLAACRWIPPGQTRSYGELAALAGSPGAARAVGRAMATNTVPLVIPCHRVVGSAGQLGGFSAQGGLNQKRRLLELEGATGKWAGAKWTNKSAWNELPDSARIRPRRRKPCLQRARMD